ncbi:MAG: hypothetical protein DHS20C05_17750 [Hyphococcus sp.]|nr:MAG: hypothetical protein DHS20C05_17750 [Marinicaulis sp.]
MRIFAALALCLALAACSGEKTASPSTDNTADSAPETAAVDGGAEAIDQNDDPASGDDLDKIAEDFVKLALAAGVHDAAFVDAYNGPEEWAEAAKTEARSLEDLEQDAQALLIRASRANADTGSVRSSMLEKQTRAALARIQMVRGDTFPFDEETRLLYDVVAPQYDVSEFHNAISEINDLLPGDAPLHERVDAFRSSLAIPEDKLQAVFEAAIAECRRRTLEHYDLPEDETFRLEFVTDQPWSGYNWYQGGHESLIQVNTDFPIMIDRAVDLGCHEGYPGHHTWNVFIERDLLGEKGWIEYSIYPLFSPMSVTAEGSANYGIELTFPGAEKIAFERDVLFPLAGLDPADAGKLEALNEASSKLSHARNHIARAYLDEKVDREEAIRMTMEFGLQSRERAEQGVRFVETYRGYVLNYNIGRDIVADYVARKADGGMDRWEAFETLLTTPLSASDIQSAK